MAEAGDGSDEEDILLEDIDETPVIGPKLELLEQKCAGSRIKISRSIFTETGLYATVEIPSGKNTRKISIYSEEKIDLILSIDITNFSYIDGYEAICSYSDKYIEAGLGATPFGIAILYSRITGKVLDFSTYRDEIISISPPTADGQPSLEIGPATDKFLALSRGPRTITLKLSGTKATTNEAAAKELRTYADSLFLKIDLLHGGTFTLRRPALRRPLMRRSRSTQENREISYPTSRYNEQSMSLYWYARSARDMPLLQYLAFYQCIEYYFPRYSQSEARRRLANILKSPTFRLHSSDDLDRAIAAIKISRTGDLGSEKSQLRAVISECISSEEIRHFLSQSKEREEYFSHKSGVKSYHKIPISSNNPDLDLRNDVADRIYDIRCKIVHTKNDERDEPFTMLLPFSRDADLLSPDIELVQFVATSVLIASSDGLS